MAAHEFGHVLGIHDGYEGSSLGTKSTEKINSIMCDQWGYKNKIGMKDRKATSKDIKKAKDKNVSKSKWLKIIKCDKNVKVIGQK